jgi:Fic family protein
MAARQAAALYKEPHQFERLFPQKDLSQTRARARDVVQRSLKLSASAHENTRTSLRGLVRAMNSYYSNRIEGQATHPRNIERALKRDFSEEPDTARLQRIAVAHIEAERDLEQQSAGGAKPLLSSFALQAHKALYGRLSKEDRTTQDGAVVEPGAMRTDNVDVGRHAAPDYRSLPAFLARFDEFYGSERSAEDMLIAMGCAHQRLVWIHPFIDGNGRAARLQTHCALWPMTRGLWSPNRGLARRRDDYYARLEDADEPRRGDLDGRGNLSEEGLRRWVNFFLDICEDQVSFMARMLDLDHMKRRIEALITFRMAEDKSIRPEAALPLFHLFAAGPLARGEFQQMTGLGERVARSLLSHLLATGLAASEGLYAPVRFAMPLDSLQFLFPDLYPEAATGLGS